MSRTLLFVYGLLQPQFHPPKQVYNQWRDSLKGRLYDLGEYPGGIEIGQGPKTFEGSVLDIDDSELEALDEFEDVRGSSCFRRIRATTESGADVWVYEYFGPLPETPPIPRWPAP
ncbi:gamma-glutamylcyclotransferase [bacterium]|nr:gamma-glutamylcyclotransferase [bacterium]